MHYSFGIIHWKISELKKIDTKTRKQLNMHKSLRTDWKNESASENAKTLKHIFKSKMNSTKGEKWKNEALHGQHPMSLGKPQVNTVTANKWLSSSLKGERGTTRHSSRPGNKHQKLPGSNMWPTSGEQMQNVFAVWRDNGPYMWRIS